jgi:hypothetical protein
MSTQQGPSAKLWIALALAIFSWLGGTIICAVPGWILAQQCLGDIKAGTEPKESHSIANVAKWMSIINVVLTMIVIIVAMVLFAGLFATVRTAAPR